MVDTPMEMVYKAWIDGSYTETKDGPIMGIGVVITRNEEHIWLYSTAIQSEGSSNAAEYMALLRLLEYLKAEKITEEVLIRSDSKLLVNQMNGIWSIKDGAYRQYAVEALELALSLNVKIKWTSRKNNRLADFLSKTN